MHKNGPLLKTLNMCIRFMITVFLIITIDFLKPTRISVQKFIIQLFINNVSTAINHDFELPAMPSLPSPKLPKDFKLPSPPSALADKQCPPQYIGALCDYCAKQESDRILSFKTGNHGVLLKRGREGWWGVKIGNKKGWVPAAYWHILQVSKYFLQK